MSDAPDLPLLVRAEKTFMRMPSRPHWIEPVVEYLRQKAVSCGVCPETRSTKLLVALHEALANAVVHGNLELPSDLKDRDDSSFAEALAQRAADPVLADRSVDILVDYDGERCRWIVTDQGKGFDVARVLERLQSDEPAVSLASGRGILIMRSFLDEVSYEDGGRRLVLTLQRQPGEEKRQHPRLDTRQTVRVAPIRADGSVDWEAAYEAMSHNLSETGMGLLQERLAGMDRILIGIYAEGRPIYIPAEVRHCRSVGEGLVELGCRFQTRAKAAGDSGAELASHPEGAPGFIARLLEKRKGPPHGSDERRAHPRAVFNDPIQIEHPGAAAPHAGYARDLSRDGISFITTVPLSSQTITIVLPQDDELPLRLRAYVVRCNKIEEGFYDVGAAFLDQA
jgi:anti-sigma regulatory factor (Ser/Thr protein kinase)